MRDGGVMDFGDTTEGKSFPSLIWGGIKTIFNIFVKERVKYKMRNGSVKGSSDTALEQRRQEFLESFPKVKKLENWEASPERLFQDTIAALRYNNDPVILKQSFLNYLKFYELFKGYNFLNPNSIYYKDGGEDDTLIKPLNSTELRKLATATANQNVAAIDAIIDVVGESEDVSLPCNASKQNLGGVKKTPTPTATDSASMEIHQ